MSTAVGLRMKISVCGGIAIAALAPPHTARADIIVTSVNSGFADQFSATVAGDTISLSVSSNYTPDTLSYTGMDCSNEYNLASCYYTYYYNADTFYTLSQLDGLGLSFSTGGLLQSGVQIGANTGFTASETVLEETSTPYIYGSTWSGPYTYQYSCGKYTCDGNYYWLAQNVTYSDTYTGPLLSTPFAIGYLGLELDVGGQTDYGYAEFELDGSGGQDLDLQLLSVGYNTDGSPILTGAAAQQDLPPPAPVSEPPALLSLISGLALLTGMHLPYRRRK